MDGHPSPNRTGLFQGGVAAIDARNAAPLCCGGSRFNRPFGAVSCPECGGPPSRGSPGAKTSGSASRGSSAPPRRGARSPRYTRGAGRWADSYRAAMGGKTGTPRPLTGRGVATGAVRLQKAEACRFRNDRFVNFMQIFCLKFGLICVMDVLLRYMIYHIYIIYA